jgi:hypothetical protein
MKQYPTEAARAEGSVPESAPPSSPAQAGSGRKVLTQMVLPLVILVVVVGGITFVAQFGINRNPTPKPGTPSRVLPLKFDNQKLEQGGVFVQAIWDPTDPSYAVELESKKGGGQYYFLCHNTNQDPAELGFKKKSCRCARLEVCGLTAEEARTLNTSLGPLGQRGMLHLINGGFGSSDAVSSYLKREVSWENLDDAKHKDEGFVIEPAAAGLIRMSWKPPERGESHFRHTADLWMQMKDRTRSRRELQLLTEIAFTPGVRSYPDGIEVKDWTGDKAEGEFSCWSATRAHFDLSAQSDPSIEVKTAPLTWNECDKLEKDVRDGLLLPTRVLSGYRVHVTVYQKGKKDQLEQGHFERLIHLKSKEVPGIAGVKVSGYLPADVVVGEGKEGDRGKITLGNFRVSHGKTKSVILLTSPGVMLLSGKDQIEKTPRFIKVELTRMKSPGAEEKSRWKLDLVVPADPKGDWPPDSAIVLRIKQPDQSERRVRIPIIANPFQHQ